MSTSRFNKTHTEYGNALSSGTPGFFYCQGGQRAQGSVSLPLKIPNETYLPIAGSADGGDEVHQLLRGLGLSRARLSRDDHALVPRVGAQVLEGLRRDAVDVRGHEATPALPVEVVPHAGLVDALAPLRELRVRVDGDQHRPD